MSAGFCKVDLVTVEKLAIVWVFKVCRRMSPAPRIAGPELRARGMNSDQSSTDLRSYLGSDLGTRIFSNIFWSGWVVLVWVGRVRWFRDVLSERSRDSVSRISFQNNLPT